MERRFGLTIHPTSGCCTSYDIKKGVWIEKEKMYTSKNNIFLFPLHNNLFEKD
jgi:hypothetical protein